MAVSYRLSTVQGCAGSTSTKPRSFVSTGTRAFARRPSLTGSESRPSSSTTGSRGPGSPGPGLLRCLLMRRCVSMSTNGARRRRSQSDFTSRLLPSPGACTARVSRFGTDPGLGAGRIEFHVRSRGRFGPMCSASCGATLPSIGRRSTARSSDSSRAPRAANKWHWRVLCSAPLATCGTRGEPCGSRCMRRSSSSMRSTEPACRIGFAVPTPPRPSARATSMLRVLLACMKAVVGSESRHATPRSWNGWTAGADLPVSEVTCTVTDDKVRPPPTVLSVDRISGP